MENSREPVKNFRAELRRLRPDVDREIRKNNVRRQLALALRFLRKSKKMTQKDIEQNATLTQSAISKLESPSGPFPTLETIMEYVKACNGHMLLSFSTHEFNRATFDDREFNETDTSDTSDSQDRKQYSVSVRFNAISDAETEIEPVQAD